MGDSGALLLGLLMAVSTSVVGGRADTDQRFIGQTFFFLAPLVFPLFILGVPILDPLFAIIRRATKRQALDVADKGHLHHRLMNLGHGHRRSVLILWAWTALLSAFVLYPVLSGENPAYLPFGVIALGIVLFTVLHPSVRQARRAERQRHRRPALSAPRLSAARARRLPAGVGEVGVALVLGRQQLLAAAATAPHATHASAPPTETRATPAAASSARTVRPGAAAR